MPSNLCLETEVRRRFDAQDGQAICRGGHTRGSDLMHGVSWKHTHKEVFFDKKIDNESIYNPSKQSHCMF